jgi:SAM-dependent methyltransferase
MSTTTTFDPAAYKATTTEQWQAAARAWHEWGPLLEVWLGEATERMLDRAGVSSGTKVLDVAAGAGGQSIAAARRVGPSGRVLATDISARILEFAESAAGAEGLENIATRVADGEALDLEPGHFDAAISRLGLIYFPDRHAALRGIHRALRPGGRLAAIVYSTPADNAFFAVPVSFIRERVDLPPPAAGQPGPFSLGTPGVIEAELEHAGFTDISVDTIDAPLRTSSAAECVRFERESFGALHQMLAGLDVEAQARVWRDIEAALSAYDGPDGFEGPCQLLVAAATKE